MTLLAAARVTGGYGGRSVVVDVSLAVAPGHCVAILGPNGAGKSTMLRLLAGILPVTSGSVELLGRPLPSWRRRDVATVVGFVPQLLALTFPLTVRELVEQGRAPHLGPWRPPTAKDSAAVTRALARVDLAAQALVPMQHLSGGERQRALVARALASEPRVLLLDEPATALDVGHQLELVGVIRQLLDEGVGVALVVHDWNLALRLANEIVVLKAGRLHAAGTPADLLRGTVFSDVFGVGVDVLRCPDGSPIVVPTALLR